MQNVALRLVEPARNRFRLYALAETTTLFGEPALLISWGRIGKAPRARTEVFGSCDELQARWRTLVAARAAHGYRAA
jgi:predicted DNA-binding WGR domain protein